MENLLNKVESLNKQDWWNLEWTLQYPEYEERPVDIKTFINSPLYMDSSKDCWEPIKDQLVNLFVGYDDPGMRWAHDEAVFDAGIGSGKSFRASIITAYSLYRILILKNPQEFLGLAKGSSIYFINMSVRAEQAKKVVFGEITSRISNAPWFKNKGYLPSTKIRSELQFPKNISIIPGNSRETFPLGFNLLGGVMDEAAWYNETESHDVAEEIYNALHNRIKNRFGDKGILVMISSPRYVDDFIEKKMEEAKKNPRIFSIRETSWDSKPQHLFTGERFEMEGYSIPVEYRTEAERNFDRFKRDYMAIPSLALEPYFKQWNLVEGAIDPNIQNPLTPNNTFQEWFAPEPNSQYFMHIDLSLTTDATGLAMCHKRGEIIIVDMMMRIKAEKGKEIDLAGVRNVVLALRQKGFQIQKCTFDQFQSASSIQDLQRMGINAEKLSVDKDLSCYETLKEGINLGKIKFYRNDVFMMELRRLEMIKAKYIDHPPGGSKDLSDAVAGAVYNCVVGQNMFSFGFAGGNKIKTPEEALKEDAVKNKEGLVPYGSRWSNDDPFGKGRARVRGGY